MIEGPSYFWNNHLKICLLLLTVELSDRFLLQPLNNLHILLDVPMTPTSLSRVKA